MDRSLQDAEQGAAERGGRPEPYVLALMAFRQPVAVALAFSLSTAAATALIGLPAFALGWLAASVSLDLVVQTLYRRWLRAPLPAQGQYREASLLLCTVLRTSLWMVAPIALVWRAPSVGAFGFLALTTATLTAAAVSTGWASRTAWIGILIPTLAGLVVAVAPEINLAQGAGLALGLASFALTASLINAATRQLLAAYEKADRRTAVAMAEMQASLAQSEIAERRAEEALERTARSEERLNMAMKMADLHIWEMDYVRGELIKAGAEDTFFTEPKTYDELNEDIMATVDERDRDRVKADWRAHLKEGAPYHPEYRVVRRGDDKVVWTASTVKLITDDQRRALRLIGVLQNITDRKEAELQLIQAKEEAEAANRTKSQFLANMSHEIRTPMNGVIGMNELLLRTGLTADQRKFAEAVRISADSLLGIINDILDISKLEAGKVELECIDFCLHTLVEDVVELLAPKAFDKGVELACYVDVGARAPLKGDPTRLRQILLNLASNGLKFTEAGHVAIAVRSQAEDDGRTRLRIEVQDTGIGLTDEQKPKLFQNFQQADGSTTRKFGGTGLGLAICRQLVELMGGRIGIEDRPGGGSIFWFEVACEAGQEPKSASASVVTADLRGVKILIVDDLEINRTIYREQLEHEGALVSEAAGAAACLAQMARAEAAKAPFDLILMDHQMPDVSGDELIAQIRARADWRQPKIVMASSMGSPPEGDVAFDAFLNKPTRLSTLLACLAGVMGDGSAPVQAEPQVGDLALPQGDAQAHVLLAEDNEINTLLASEILRQVGFSIECVRNGREALEAAAQGRFDLILMDVHMPVMDGLEATRRIRALSGTAGQVPIVAMTANAMKSDREACLEAGMNDFVSKPFKPDEFLGVLARMFADPDDLAEVKNDSQAA